MYHLKGREILSNNESFSVPKLEVFETVEDQSHSNRKRSTFNDSVTPPKKKICTSTRAGKGTHGLRVVKTLLEDEENWKHISKDDYQYLGVFPNEQMQVAYYCEDCTKLDQNCSTDPHFLWHDIQMSKGKVNKDYSIFVELGGVKEELIHRCAPCNGVKVCSQSECKFVAPISRLRSCPDHPEATLEQSNELSPTKCPVEFAYIYPKNFNHDNRRWIMGYVRQQKAPTNNLHNHAIPRGTKMCSLVKKAIQESASINPQLKAKQISQGKGLPFIPGAVDSASTHIGRVAQQVKKGRQMASSGSSWDIADFEKLLMI